MLHAVTPEGQLGSGDAYARSGEVPAALKLPAWQGKFGVAIREPHRAATVRRTWSRRCSTSAGSVLSLSTSWCISSRVARAAVDQSS